MAFHRVLIAGAAAFALSASFGAAGARAQQAFDAAQIGEILEEESYSVSEFGADMVAVSVADQVILINTDGPDGDISYLTYISGLTEDMVGYEFINEFNNSIKFGRVFTDEDGDVVIQYDRNAAGGVTPENIVDDFELFLDLISVFLNDVAEIDFV